jgi:hypothetical protein
MKVKVRTKERQKSPMELWAEREVEIAIKKEQEGGEDFSTYRIECCKAALSVYKMLLRQEHSGYSIQIVKSILNKLIDGKPLTPIEKDMDDWMLIGNDDVDPSKPRELYQSTRMASVFKTIWKDGRVTYKDVDSVVCIDVDENGEPTGNSYYSQEITNFVREKFPMRLPHTPGRFKVYCETFLSHWKHGDYDTRKIIKIEKPDGETLIVDKYFKYDDDEFTEISEAEYLERKLNESIRAKK